MLKRTSKFVLEVLPYLLSASIAAVVVPGFRGGHAKRPCSRIDAPRACGASVRPDIAQDGQNGRRRADNVAQVRKFAMRGIISGANVASHAGDEVPQDVEVGVLSQEVTNKDAVVVNSATEANPPQKVAKDATVHLKPAQIAELIERGSEFVGTGDLNSARLLFERAAEAREPKAAFALAATCDPIVLEQLGIHGPAADVQMARAWYQKAERLGSPSASWRLELLASRGR
jgi:hypothetical protein